MELPLRIVIGIAAAGIAWTLVEAQSQTKAPPVVYCIEVKERDRLRMLALDAIDQAFREQVQHLFEVMISDPNSTLGRASKGMQNALAGHIRARRLALDWDPPVCGAK